MNFNLNNSGKLILVGVIVIVVVAMVTGQTEIAQQILEEVFAVAKDSLLGGD